MLQRCGRCHSIQSESPGLLEASGAPRSCAWTQLRPAFALLPFAAKSRSEIVDIGGWHRGSAAECIGRSKVKLALDPEHVQVPAASSERHETVPMQAMKCLADLLRIALRHVDPVASCGDIPTSRRGAVIEGSQVLDDPDLLPTKSPSHATFCLGTSDESWNPVFASKEHHITRAF